MTTLNDSQVDGSTVNDIVDDEPMDDDSTTPSVMLNRKGLFGNSAACLSDDFENTSNDCVMEVDEPVNENKGNGDSNGKSIRVQDAQSGSSVLNEEAEKNSTVDKIDQQEEIPAPTEESSNVDIDQTINESQTTESAPTENVAEEESSSGIVENRSVDDEASAVDVDSVDVEDIVVDEPVHDVESFVDDEPVHDDESEPVSSLADEPVPVPTENHDSVNPEPENTDVNEEVVIDTNEEEKCVKKIISMDTSREEEKEEDEGEAVEDLVEVVDEEEEEAPRKRAKRNAPKESNEDDETDDIVEEKGESDVEDKYDSSENIPVEQPGNEEATEKVQEDVPETPKSVRSSSSKVTPSNVDEKEESSEDIPVEQSDDQETTEEVQEDIIETPKSGRSSRAKATPKAELSSARSTRGKVSQENKEEDTPKRTPRGTRSSVVEQSSGRSSRNKKSAPEQEIEEDNTANEEVEIIEEENAEEPETEKPKSTARSSRSSGVVKTETNTPASSRSRRSTAAPTPEPKTTGKRKSRAAVREEEEEEEKITPKREKEVESPVENPASTRSRRERKVVEKTEEVVATPKSAVKKSASKSRSAKKVTINEPEDENEPKVEEGEEKEAPKKTPKSTKSTPAYKKQAAKVSDEFDPYDLDTEMEKHPEPLKNIHMEVQNFGTVKYAKVGNSASKYESTERAAESRISSLSNTPPQRKERRSLAEMIPGKEKIQHRVSMGSSKGRAKTKKTVEEIEDDEEMDQKEASPPVVKSAKGKKRKADDDASPAVAPKKAAIELPNLTAEEQWQVDHPEDEHEPHAPGARVYALFGKVYYPAVVASERDGLGRFKVQYTADKIVKDVPSAGIIPLRAVVAGKQCFYKEDVLNVIACPNAASASEWTEGVFELEALDENGDPTGDTIRADWSEISLDMGDWKDYINKKSSEATQIVADNITTPAQIYRAARKHVQTPVVKAKDSTKKPQKNSNQSVEEQNNSLSLKKLIMNDKGIGNDVFQGKLFILTSSTRQNTKSVPLCMRKNELREFVEENGGTVTEHFQDVDDNSTLEAFLISDRFYRTHKYLAALARGVPCISQNWIKQCANIGEMVDYAPFVLKAGVSALDDKEYPLIKDHSSTLSGLKFFVHTTQEVREKTQTGPGSTFIQIWHPLIELLGGEYVDCDPKDFEKHECDAVITDGNVDETVEEAANDKGVRILTSEFIIEAIITGKAPDLDEEKFSLDHLRKTKQEEKPKKSKGRSH